MRAALLEILLYQYTVFVKVEKMQTDVKGSNKAESVCVVIMKMKMNENTNWQMTIWQHLVTFFCRLQLPYIRNS